MVASACGVSGWLEEHQHGMINCPYQPGQLVISKGACMKRHMAAEQENYDDIMAVDFFRYKLKKGLFLCKQCAIGRRLASPLLAASMQEADLLNQAAGS